MPANGSPVVGGGAVWVTDFDHGTLYALDPATGQPLTQLAIGDLPHFASPTLGDNRAYLGTMHGVGALHAAVGSVDDPAAVIVTGDVWLHDRKF